MRRWLTGLVCLIAGIACLAPWLLVGEVQIQERPCRRFVAAQATQAGLGHRFASVILAFDLAREMNATFAIGKDTWTLASAHGSYPWIRDMFNWSEVPVLEFLKNLTVHRPQHVKQAKSLLKRHCDVAVLVRTGDGEFCPGAPGGFCMHTWRPGAYERARLFFRAKFVSRPHHKFGRCKVNSTQVLWHIRNGDVVLGNMKVLMNLLRVVSSLLKEGQSVCHVICSQKPLCHEGKGPFCSLKELLSQRTSEVYVREGTPVAQVLDHMSQAGIVVCTGSSLCELGVMLNKDGVGIQPPAKLAQMYSLTDVHSRNWNMTRLSNAVWVDKEGNFVKGGLRLSAIQ